MVAGQEAIIYVLRTIDKKRQITPKGKPVAIHYANDLHKAVPYEDMKTLLEKFATDDKILKVLRVPETSATHCWELSLNKSFNRYHDKLRQTKIYQDYTGEKPISKGPVLGANMVDFQATPEENKDKYISAGQVNELYEMSEAERNRIFEEHLMPKHKQEVEQTFQTINDFREQFKLPAVSSIPMPRPNVYQAEQVRLLQQIADNNSQQTDKRLTAPTYNKAKRQLIFCNTVIVIPANTDQEALCQLLFRSGKPVKRPLEIGDALLKLGVPLDRVKDNKKISYAKRELNERIAKATQVDDLFIIENHQITFNEKYV